MKKVILVSCIFMFGCILSADEYDKKRAELEQQIKELEAQKKKDDEIKDLQNRLQELQSQKKQPQEPQTRQVTHTKAQVSESSTQDVAKRKTGLLLGVYAGNGSFKTQDQSSDLIVETTGSLIPVGARIGYQKFRSENLGFRIYGDFNYSSAESKTKVTSVKSEVKRLIYGAGLDLLFDFKVGKKSYIGLFAGLGYGAMSFEQTNKDNSSTAEFDIEASGLVYSVGMGLTLNYHHRIEVGYKKIPVNDHSFDYTSQGESGTFKYKSDDFVSIGYQYNF